MKSTVDILICYYDECGCYDEDQYTLNSLLDYQHLIQDILLLSENKKTEYTRIFVTYDDDTSKEITLGDIKSEGYIGQEIDCGTTRSIE